MATAVTLKFQDKLRSKRNNAGSNNCSWNSLCCLAKCYWKEELNNSKTPLKNLKVVFIDRGIPDVVAYMDYIGDEYPEHFTKACENYKYSKTFILPPWEEIYQSDTERYENFEQALEIQKHLIETYKKYGYDLIEVPKDTVENRILYILDKI